MAITSTQLQDISFVIVLVMAIIAIGEYTGNSLIDIFKKKYLPINEKNIREYHPLPNEPVFIRVKGHEMFFDHADVLHKGEDTYATKIYLMTPDHLPYTLDSVSRGELIYDDSDPIFMFSTNAKYFTYSPGGLEGAYKKENLELKERLEGLYVSIANYKQYLKESNMSTQEIDKILEQRKGTRERQRTRKGYVTHPEDAMAKTGGEEEQGEEGGESGYQIG